MPDLPHLVAYTSLGVLALGMAAIGFRNRYRELLQELRSLEASRIASCSSLFVVTKIFHQIDLFGAFPVNITQNLPVDKKFEFDVTASVDAFQNPESTVGATFAWSADSATFGLLSLVDDSTLKVAFAPNGKLGTTVITGTPTVTGGAPDFHPNPIIITLTTTVGAPVDFAGNVTITDSGVDSAAATPAAPTPTPPAPTPAPAPAADTPAPVDTPAPAPAPTDSGSTTTPTTGGDTSAPAAAPSDSTTTAPVGDTPNPTDAPAPADSGVTNPVPPINSAPAADSPAAPINASPDTTSTQ